MGIHLIILWYSYERGCDWCGKSYYSADYFDIHTTNLVYCMFGAKLYGIIYFTEDQIMMKQPDIFIICFCFED